MDNILNIQLTLSAECELFAFDETNYQSIFSSVKGFSIVEILTDYENNPVLQKTHILTDYRDPFLRKSDAIKIPFDGTFHYYRMLVPELSYFFSEGIYWVDNKFFTYKGEIYFSKTNLEAFSPIKVDLVTDYTEIWDNRETNSQIFWFTDQFISICKLQNCLVDKIRLYNKKIAKDGGIFVCSSNDEEKLLIDFLLEGLFAVNYLAQKRKYEDVQRIIASINTCNNICKEDDDNFNTGCNCG